MTRAQARLTAIPSQGGRFCDMSAIKGEPKANQWRGSLALAFEQSGLGPRDSAVILHCCPRT